MDIIISRDKYFHMKLVPNKPWCTKFFYEERCILCRCKLKPSLSIQILKCGPVKWEIFAILRDDFPAMPCSAVRFAAVVFPVVLGPESPDNLAVSMFLCSCKSNVQRKIRGPWRAPCQLKKSFKGQGPRLGSRWEEQRRTAVFSPWRGVDNFPSRLINDFSVELKLKMIKLVARPAIFQLPNWRKCANRVAQNLQNWQRGVQHEGFCQQIHRDESVQEPF